LFASSQLGAMLALLFGVFAMSPMIFCSAQSRQLHIFSGSDALGRLTGHTMTDAS
jgi:hypothetical protein